MENGNGDVNEDALEQGVGEEDVDADEDGVMDIESIDAGESTEEGKSIQGDSMDAESTDEDGEEVEEDGEEEEEEDELSTDEEEGNGKVRGQEDSAEGWKMNPREDRSQGSERETRQGTRWWRRRR